MDDDYFWETDDFSWMDPASDPGTVEGGYRADLSVNADPNDIDYSGADVTPDEGTGTDDYLTDFNNWLDSDFGGFGWDFFNTNPLPDITSPEQQAYVQNAITPPDQTSDAMKNFFKGLAAAAKKLLSGIQVSAGAGSAPGAAGSAGTTTQQAKPATLPGGLDPKVLLLAAGTVGAALISR